MKPSTDDETPVAHEDQAIYYVSPGGNDTSGDGSVSLPWRTIRTALEKIIPSDTPPVINLAPGTYDESVVITRSVVLQGSGFKEVTIRNSHSTDRDFTIVVDGGGSSVPPTVTIRGLRVDGLFARNRGICAVRAALRMSDVHLYLPGVVAISLGPDISDFVIEDTTIGYLDSSGYQGVHPIDLGIDVKNGSSGSIRNVSAGDHIDHIINIGYRCNVTIRDCRLTGSPIYYADGIRIQGASDVSVHGTEIRRPPGSEPVQAGAMHNPPYAGIEAASGSEDDTRVIIDGCAISGFDVAIGVNLRSTGLLVQNCSLAGSQAAVKTYW